MMADQRRGLQVLIRRAGGLIVFSSHSHIHSASVICVGANSSPRWLRAPIRFLRVQADPLR